MNFYFALGGACGLFLGTLVLGMLCSMAAAQLKLRIDHWDSFLPGDLERLVRDDRNRVQEGDLERGMPRARHPAAGGKFDRGIKFDRQSVDLVAESVGGDRGANAALETDNYGSGTGRTRLPFPDVTGVEEPRGNAVPGVGGGGAVAAAARQTPDTESMESTESTETTASGGAPLPVRAPGRTSRVDKGRGDEEEVMSAYKAPRETRSRPSEGHRCGMAAAAPACASRDVHMARMAEERRGGGTQQEPPPIRASRIVDAYAVPRDGARGRRWTGGSVDEVHARGDGGKDCDGDDERVEHDARGGAMTMASTAADSDESFASMGDRNPNLFLQPPANHSSIEVATVLF